MKFTSWYKNIIESFKPEPPVKSWDNIQDQLDIDNSWNEINSYLNKQRLISRVKMSAVASIIIIAISASAWLVLRTGMDDKNTLEAENHTFENIRANEEDQVIPKEKQQNAGITEDNKPYNIKTDNITGTDSGNSIITNITKDDIPLKVAMAQAEENGDYENKRIIEKLDPVKPYINPVSDLNLNNIEPGKFYPEERDPEKIRKVFRKFYVGATGQLANTWLINQKTISGLKSTSLVTTNPSFGSNFGMFAGTNLLDNLDLQVDLNILAQNNQDYNEYLDGNYVTSNMRFNYTQLGLSFRYYINSNTVMKGEHALNLGPYLGYLHNASQVIDQETLFITDTYNTLDYGLQAGYEYVFPLFDRLGMGTGFKAYYGLNNIYAGSETIPDYLNITNNASVNITLSFKYLVK